MPIPHEDMLCRFIPGHRKSWSKTQSRPRPSVFKENRGLSVWHIESLALRGVKPSELRIGGLEGHGQARHTVGDYLEAARQAAQRFGVALNTIVEWRTGDEYVKPDWRRWAYAHVQVEHSPEPGDDTEKIQSALVLFRQTLSKNARHIVAPDDI